MSKPSRIFLSAPHMSGLEQQYINQAFDSNWIAPLGENVNEFEREFAEYVGSEHALALSSGTAALHLALSHIGVGSHDEVFVSTLTFCASVNPILYLGAKPVFVDSELASWNMDPMLLRNSLHKRAQQGRLPKAVILVHLYGQCADIAAITEVCREYEVQLIEDAAEALGATYQGKSPGVFGRAGIFSFNGNKIITTSGGGMLVSDDEMLIQHAFKLATQARDDAPHYQHSEVGYNYRMSNVLAGIGRGQLQVLDDRVAARRANCAAYQEGLSNVPGISFMPEATWGTHNRWLTVVMIDPSQFGADRETIRLALESENIEARPVWKPMHMQPVYSQYESIGGEVAEKLFKDGLCLPSGSSMSNEEIARVIHIIRSCHQSSAVPLFDAIAPLS